MVAFCVIFIGAAIAGILLIGLHSMSEGLVTFYSVSSSIVVLLIAMWLIAGTMFVGGNPIREIQILAIVSTINSLIFGRRPR